MFLIRGKVDKYKTGLLLQNLEELNLIYTVSYVIVVTVFSEKHRNPPARLSGAQTVTSPCVAFKGS